MKGLLTILFFGLLLAKAGAQPRFRTVVPQEPVVIGESFQVQYIVEGGDESINVKPPVFSNFRFVTGPNIYNGSVNTADGAMLLNNWVYTVEPVSIGRFSIQGATINVNGKLIRSNTVSVTVISKEEAIKRYNAAKGITSSDYFLRPGENPTDKIRQNLFVKVMVDKRNCFVGQPILATFKLYSRLESRSDIIKNPGFYGFTVYDMVNLADKEKNTESINGRSFDVHTIRKVQLYPLQAGEFTIDPMEISNKVEFSKSAVNKKTEQEVAEGILGGKGDEKKNENTDVYETSMSTEKITINVKALPEKNKPAAFGGATGRFSIKAGVEKNTIAKNEQAFLAITISGKGNFVQLDAPTITWPAGIEGFEPVVKDELDKKTVPLSGTRVFRYPFVCSQEGKVKIPAISFSYFDTDTNNYKAVSTEGIDLIIGPAIKAEPIKEEHKESIAEKSEQAARTAGIVVVAAVALILLYWGFRKKDPPPPPPVVEEAPLPSPEELLQPAQELAATSGHSFYSTLYAICWQFLSGQFGLTGSDMNKQLLSTRMHTKGIDSDTQQEILDIIRHCETGMYTSAELTEDRQQLLERTANAMQKIQSVA